MVKKGKILNRIKEIVLEIDETAEVLSFSSQARGEAGVESDWDILILVPHSTDLKEEQKFRHKLIEIELEYGVAISTLVKSKEEWQEKLHVTPLFQNISQEGVIL